MNRVVAVVAACLLLSVPPACGPDDGGDASSRSGIRGVVLAGPMCPVVSESSPCPDEPVDGARIEILRGERVVGTATSDRGGRFEVRLEPGTYEARAVPTSDLGLSAKPVSVVVRQGRFTEVDLPIDTGIR
jgi:hypothetical protein